MSNLQQLLDAQAPILADGAMGTLLHGKGISLDSCFDEINLSRPELVAQVHVEYIGAGAQLIETNTFGANSYKLAEYGLQDRVAEINRAAVDLARNAVEESKQDVLVAGSVGPLGVRLAPFGRVGVEQAHAAFAEQIKSLAAAGADLILIETHSDLYEARAAIEAAHKVAGLPIIASITFTRDDLTILGDTSSQAASFLADNGVDLIGANCSGGPAQLHRILGQMRKAAPNAKLSVMPNAGWPERISGRIMYPASPQYFAEYARAFRTAGADIVGGCCGTTPEHIHAMRKELDQIESQPTVHSTVDVNEDATEVWAASQAPTELSRKLSDGQFVISVEMDPPRGFSTHKLLAGAHLLAEAGADVINVADSPMARMRMSPWAVCELIQRDVGLETVLHFTTRGRSLLRVQGDLLAAHAIGIRNLFVVMGDPTAIGDYPEAMDNYDVVPSGLIRLVKQGFNIGVDHSGTEIAGATSFFVGCALNIGSSNLERELKMLHRKVNAGADFILTQPLYEAWPVQKFRDSYEKAYGPLSLPLFIGLLPLYGARHAAFLANEVPGIEIPETAMDRILDAGDDASAEGTRLAIELI
ncbi:MAG: bifunctional homocysteine S-methyltransferase/methylenetetrahydrofolate reductase, partial [Anaerolineales bacterium]